MIGAEFLALLASALFGLGLVLTPRGLAALSPVQGASVSIPAAAILLAVIGVFASDWSTLHLGALTLFVIVGLFFPTGAMLLTFESNKLIGRPATETLRNLAPLFAVFLAIAMLDEAPDVFQGAAIALVVIGGTILVGGGTAGPAGWPLWALALPLAAALITGAAQPIIKAGLTVWPEPLAAALFGYLASGLVIAIWARLREPYMMPMLDRKGVYWFVLVGFCNGAAVACLYAALAKGAVTIVTPLAATYPLVVVLFGGGAQGTIRTIAGIAVIVIGAATLLAV